MNDLEQLKTIDERIAETERVLNFLHERRREIINRNNLNKTRCKMPKKHNLIPTAFKCPECGEKCLHNIDLDLFVCTRPLITTDGQIKGSCGKFYLDKTKYKQ